MKQLFIFLAIGLFCPAFGAEPAAVPSASAEKVATVAR